MHGYLEPTYLEESAGEIFKKGPPLGPNDSMEIRVHRPLKNAIIWAEGDRWAGDVHHCASILMSKQVPGLETTLNLHLAPLTDWRSIR